MNLNTGIRKSKDDAAWQYILDHAHAIPSANHEAYLIRFYIKDRKEWDLKIRQRMSGVVRNDERKLEQERANKIEGARVWDRKTAEFGRKLEYVDKRGTYTQKMILYLYRKCRNYLDALRPSINS